MGSLDEHPYLKQHTGPTTFIFLSILDKSLGYLLFQQVDSSAAEKEKKSEPEPTFEILTNPARVVPGQEKFIKFLEDSRYAPVKAAASGFILLKDLRPTEPEVLALTDAPTSTTSTAAAATPPASTAAAMAVDDEPQPPQPFEYSSWLGLWFALLSDFLSDLIGCISGVYAVVIGNWSLRAVSM